MGGPPPRAGRNCHPPPRPHLSLLRLPPLQKCEHVVVGSRGRGGEARRGGCWHRTLNAAPRKATAAPSRGPPAPPPPRPPAAHTRRAPVRARALRPTPPSPRLPDHVCAQHFKSFALLIGAIQCRFCQKVSCVRGAHLLRARWNQRRRAAVAKQPSRCPILTQPGLGQGWGVSGGLFEGWQPQTPLCLVWFRGRSRPYHP